MTAMTLPSRMAATVVVPLLASEDVRFAARLAVQVASDRGAAVRFVLFAGSDPQAVPAACRAIASVLRSTGSRAPVRLVVTERPVSSGADGLVGEHGDLVLLAQSAAVAEAVRPHLGGRRVLLAADVSPQTVG